MFNLKIASIKKLVIFAIFFCSCSDYSKSLGNDYFYRKEGGPLNEIYCEKTFVGRIPATVIDYEYNENFIIAKQKPKIPQSILYEKDNEYKYGTDKFYYWLIIKDEYLALGPFSPDEYVEARKKYSVPDKLELNN